MVAVSVLVANVPAVELGQVFDPADPPVTALQETMPVLLEADTDRYGPGITLVIVTSLSVVRTAVTPTAGNAVLQALIAAVS